MSPTRKRPPTNGRPRIKLHVLGAAGAVTGSLNLFEVFEGNKVTRFLLEVGLHQENESINHENRFPAGITAKDIDFVIISHAHIDHSGFLPKLVRDGFKGFAYTHAATKDILEFLLPDSGYLQEDQARRENKWRKRDFERFLKRFSARKASNGRSKSHRRKEMRMPQPPQKVLPLYTQADAKACLSRIKTIEYDRVYRLSDAVTVKFTEACHILGAAVVTLEIGNGSNKRRFCFTGNIGRPNTPILKSLAQVAQADYVMTESTYGNKLHENRDRLQILADIINRGYKRAKQVHPQFGAGVIVIPAFAVGRVQSVLFDLRALMSAKRIPEIPVYLDSPMAIKATAVHRKYKNLYNPEAAKLVAAGIDPFKTPRYTEVEDLKQSELLGKPTREPIIIIGSSGMASGGRVLGHIATRLPGSNNTIVFVGYQGSGTLGKTLVDRKGGVAKLYGKPVEVRATIEFMSDYSGHADYSDMIRWLAGFQQKPKNVFLVHGEPETLSGFKSRIESTLGCKVTIPKHREVFNLD